LGWLNVHLLVIKIQNSFLDQELIKLIGSILYCKKVRATNSAKRIDKERILLWMHLVPVSINTNQLLARMVLHIL
jgi:hypothetical protein